MPAMRRLCLAAALASVTFALAVYAVGCSADGQTTWFAKQDDKSAEAENVLDEKDPREESAGVRDTIKTVAWVEGLRRMSVGGYGLVVGLAKTGSSQCPRPIREYMLDDMRRRYRLGQAYKALKRYSPERLLDSEETAVVTVYGEIPAAAQVGATFDLTVRALSGTDVSSLENGWLMPCSLKLWANGQPVEGRILGEGMGQVFINPFGLKKDAATKADPRVGRVIGGGRATEARRIRLVLTNPSAAIASRLMRLINRRFGVEPRKTADAPDAHSVDLRIPEAWQGQEAHFLQLLVHLYVPASPSFADLRLRELCEEAVQPEAALADISLAWEGLGKTALPSIRKLYTHKEPGVSYFAGRTGLRLGDDLALSVVTRHANNAESPFRELAIEELGRTERTGQAILALRPLLDADDERIRQLAYEALLEQEDSSIQTLKVGGKGGFLLDLVPSRGGFLVAAQRSGQQRIALFGSGMRCQTPAFYVHRNGAVTLAADAGAEKLKLVRQTPISGRMSPPIPCPTDVACLVLTLGRRPPDVPEDKRQGLGLSYAQVVEVLHDLCADKTIDATFAMRTDEVGQVAPGPTETARPESEL